jgi:S-formylglutathione hydrolase FrmB
VWIQQTPNEMNTHSFRTSRSNNRLSWRIMHVIGSLLTAYVLAGLALPVLTGAPAVAAPSLVLVGETHPLIYDSNGAIRYDANGLPLTSPRLIELEFANPLVNPERNTKVRVLLPDSYPDNAKYPVLYLLHGAQPQGNGEGGAHVWTQRILSPQTLFDYTAGKDLVIVMPDGGDLGFYTDWFNDGAYGAPMWETFHLAQLVPYIEAKYKVRTDRGGRVIAGVSMGGFGAMSYAARHPDLFASAYAFSGALDNTLLGPVSAAPIELIGTEAIWGPYTTQEVRWRGHNPVDLAGNLSPLDLWFRTGRGVPGGPAPDDNNPTALALEALIAPLNDEFAATLDRKGIPYFYDSYLQGAHVRYHFMESLLLAFPEIEAAFTRSVSHPAVFNYSSIEPRIRIWEWDIAVTRDVVEFLYLTDVSAASLTLRGSGHVQVKSAPVFHRQKYYRLVTTNASPGVVVSPGLVRADSTGRLTFEVQLGASHTFQQFTAPQRLLEELDPGYWRKATITIVEQ